MRKEIEVKAQVADLEEIKSKLVQLGCVFSEPVIQHDVIFVDDNYGPFDEFQPGKNLLRIRESGGTFLFTIKQPASNEFDSIEYETKIDDPEEMKKAITLMGFHAMAEVHKTRTKAKLNEWEICLDAVEGLGSFIELEEIAEDPDAEEIQEKMFSLLESLGVTRKDRVTHGYDTLVYMKNKTS